MNGRLKHTPEGYLRAMRMTSAQFLVFVEGENHDEYFYAEICKTLNINYEVRRAREIPYSVGKSAGGKLSLIKWFEYLKKRAALITNSSEQKQVSVFFLDKDVDDLLKEITQSPHIIYTKYYCIENHIFLDGDLNKAAAIISSHDPQKQIIGDCAKWRQEVAEQWKEWVKLCLFSEVNELKCECSYSNVPKENNNPLYKMLKDDICFQYKETVKASSKLAEKQFKKSFNAISNKVDKLYATGKHDTVFKGKWYAGFFEAKIEKTIGTLTNKTGHKSYFQIIMGTLNFDDKWTEHFKKPLKLLINKINIENDFQSHKS